MDYKEAKSMHPEHMILVRCGQFYLIYGKDAEDAIRILNLAPTQDSKRRIYSGISLWLCR